MKRSVVIILVLLLILCSCSEKDKEAKIIEPTTEELELLKADVSTAAKALLDGVELDSDWVYCIHGPYAVFEEKVAICMYDYGAHAQAFSSQQVGEIEFSFPELGPQMYLYYDSKIINLTDAREQGIVSDEEVKIIKENYNGYNDENLWTTVTVKAEEK